MARRIRPMIEKSPAKAYATSRTDVRTLLERVDAVLDDMQPDARQATWEQVGTVRHVRESLIQLLIGLEIGEDQLEGDVGALLEDVMRLSR